MAETAYEEDSGLTCMAHSFQCLYLVGFEWVEPCILLLSTSQSEEEPF